MSLTLLATGLLERLLARARTLLPEPATRIPALIPHPTRHGDVVRGGKPDAAFGIELPSRPYLALRARQLD